MKEADLLNGQLKPTYNLQYGVNSKYVIWLGIYQNPTVTLTLIPFLKDMKSYLAINYKNIVADEVYDNEEIYLFTEEDGLLAYKKPQNYAMSLT